MKDKLLNYYGISVENEIWSLIIEENYKEKQFKAWIETPQGKKFLMFKIKMTYEYDENKVGPYDDEYLFFQEIAEKCSKVYIHTFKEMKKNVQLPENYE